jgi:UDP:flavonoid glycosyltransferase YjiC (YdhE family)
VADILFVTWDGGGNVPPAVAIAQELQTRGHTVRFLGHAVQAPALTAAGFEVEPNRHARAFSAHERHSPVAMMGAFGDRGMGRDLLDAVAARPADLVVVDCLMFGALDAARSAGLRFAVLEHFYDGYYERGCLRGPLGLSLALRRLRPRAALEAAVARVVTAIPELDPPPDPTSTVFVHTGPVVDVAPVSPTRHDDPMVLVSLSTFAFSGMAPALQRIVDGCAGLDARVVVTTGDALDPAKLRRPPGMEVHRFVPHVELMPQASLLVGHGGHGTTMQALAHDLPVVVMPMDRFADQPLVGRSLQQAGAGRVVAKKESAQELAPVIAAMLAEGPHRTAAARLGAAVRGLPGRTRAAEALEGLLTAAARPPGRPGARP